MTEKTKTSTGFFIAVTACILMAALASSTFLLGGPSVEASGEEVSSGWACPVDRNLTFEECAQIMKSDPGYLSEENARAAFGDGMPPEDAVEGGGAVTMVEETPICTYASRVITCEGYNPTIGDYGVDEMHGEGGADSLTGSYGNDFILGQAGDDSINGGYGDDCIIGDHDDWNLHYDEGDDTIDAGPGYDCVYCDTVAVDENCDSVDEGILNGGDHDSASNCYYDNSARCYPGYCTTYSPSWCEPNP